MYTQLRTAAVPRWTHLAAKNAVHTRRTFISNFFGKKEVSKREEILRNQDDFELSVGTKITILSKENAPGSVAFNPETDMPHHKIVQWKSRTVLPQHVESTFSRKDVSSIIAKAYKAVYNVEVDPSTNTDADLFDLSRRFLVAKAVQVDMGVDLNDAVISRCHTVSAMYEELVKMVEERYVYERNPNAIALRPEDFSAPNIYLNEERTPEQQRKELEKIVAKATPA